MTRLHRGLTSTSGRVVVFALVLLISLPVIGVGGEASDAPEKQWVFREVDSAFGSSPWGRATATSVDTKGEPIVCYLLNGTVNLATLGPDRTDVLRLTTGYMNDLSLATDAEGARHVVWSEGYGSTAVAMDATDRDGAWRIQRFGLSTEGAAGSPKIFFDSADVMHIVYCYSYTIWNGSSGHTVSRLIHAVNVTGGWSTETIFDGNSSVSELDMVRDSGGHVSCIFVSGKLNESDPLIYYHYDYSLIYVSNATGEWVWKEIAKFEESYFGSGENQAALSLDSHANPVIAYLLTEQWSPPNTYNRTLTLARSSGGVWTKTMLSTSHAYGGLAMGIDKQDRVHILVEDTDNYDPLYFTNVSGEWNVERLESVGFSGISPTVVVDSSGAVRLLYIKNDRTWPYSGRCALIQATFEKLPEKGGQGMTMSLVLATACGIAAFGAGAILGRRWPR